MKRTFTILLFLALGLSAFGQNAELSNRLISRYHSHQLKSGKSAENVHGYLWLTPLLKEAVVNWKDLTAEAQILFSPYLDRPTFTGTEKIATLGNFAFHYTTDSGDPGEDVDPTDNNWNNIPDYVENMAVEFSTVSELYHETTGFTVPPFDSDEINGAYYDIYINGNTAGDNTYGYVAPEANVGDNTNSPTLSEVEAYTSHMVMRNNYDGFGAPENALKVTAAHEYMHAVQFGYSVSMESWLMEMWATWSEEFAYPGADDNFQYLMDLFGKPDVALNLGDGEIPEHDGHWYSSWLFGQYLTEQTGQSIVKGIYEKCISYYALDAIDMELTENWSNSFDDVFVQFVISNLLLTDNQGYAPFIYLRAADYDEHVTMNGGLEYENLSVPWSFSGTDISWDSKTDGNDRLMRLSSDYFYLTADQNFKVSFSPVDAESEVVLFLLKANANSMQVDYMDESGSIYVSDQANWDVFVPFVVRLNKTEATTSSYDYGLTVNSYTPTVIENSAKEEIRIFPNPATTKITVESPQRDFKLAEIFDLSGRVILSQDLIQNYIDVSRLSSGIYFLKLTTDKGEVRVEKIIIE